MLKYGTWNLNLSIVSMSMFFDVTFCLKTVSTNMTFTTYSYGNSYGKDIQGIAMY